MDVPGRSLEPCSLLATLDRFPSIGPRRLSALGRRGIRTVLDLLYTFPFRYEDRRIGGAISDLREGMEKGFIATVRSIRKKEVRKLKAPIVEAVVQDGTGSIQVVWFGQEYLLRHLPEGSRAFFFGKVDYSDFSGALTLRSPVVELLDPEEGFRKSYHVGRIVPVYREEEGLSSAVFRRLTGDVLKTLWGETFDPLPAGVREQGKLMDWFGALVEMHFPRETGRPLETLLEPDYPPRARFIFEEFFFLEYLMMMRKRGIGLAGRSWRSAPDRQQILDFEGTLPFRLTSAQHRVCGEIQDDLASNHPMNRFLLGDVGSGKTLVAAFAIAQAIRAGVQAAVLAPTEILARQHLLTLSKVFSGPKGGHIVPVLLSQSVKGSPRREILAGIVDGTHSLVVGTHAILEEKVPFRALGLVVIDEQHKFGVAQRRALTDKGQNPDILVMTATPIPRSLALSYYGDLDLSLLDGMPPGRKPVATRVVRKSDASFWTGKIRPALERGEQVFVVLPLIEESEKIEAKNATEVRDFLAGLFGSFRVELLTGRMDGAEKEAVMAAFHRKEISILVATTVIEVGIDVPNATVMVVENAERFGLAQLHQLRGRIGRGALPGTCYLVAGAGIGEEGKARLKVLEDFPDGFRVAEEDLRMRGPGEFAGVRQSGLPMFAVADLVRDRDSLVLARELAGDFVRESAGNPGKAWDLSRLEEFIRFRYREVDGWLSIR